METIRSWKLRWWKDPSHSKLGMEYLDLTLPICPSFTLWSHCVALGKLLGLHTKLHQLICKMKIKITTLKGTVCIWKNRQCIWHSRSIYSESPSPSSSYLLHTSKPVFPNTSLCSTKAVSKIFQCPSSTCNALLENRNSWLWEMNSMERLQNTCQKGSFKNMKITLSLYSTHPLYNVELKNWVPAQDRAQGPYIFHTKEERKSWKVDQSRLVLEQVQEDVKDFGVSVLFQILQTDLQWPHPLRPIGPPERGYARDEESWRDSANSTNQSLHEHCTGFEYGSSCHGTHSRYPSICRIHERQYIMGLNVTNSFMLQGNQPTTIVMLILQVLLFW